MTMTVDFNHSITIGEAIIIFIAAATLAVGLIALSRAGKCSDTPLASRGVVVGRAMVLVVSESLAFTSMTPRRATRWT
jgi:hypothetical protein